MNVLGRTWRGGVCAAAAGDREHIAGRIVAQADAAAVRRRLVALKLCHHSADGRRYGARTPAPGDL